MNHFYNGRGFAEQYQWAAELQVNLPAGESEPFFKGLEDAIVTYMNEWMAKRALKMGDLTARIEALPEVESDQGECKVPASESMARSWV